MRPSILLSRTEPNDWWWRVGHAGAAWGAGSASLSLSALTFSSNGVEILGGRRMDGDPLRHLRRIVAELHVQRQSGLEVCGGGGGAVGQGGG